MTPGAAQPIVHGGDLDAARAAFPNAPEPWIDLSTGINPHPYPVPEFDGDVWTRLPQGSDLRKLQQVAAHRYGAARPELVVPAPGTQALIQVLPRLMPPSRVAIVGPTYAEHAAAWRREGHDVNEVLDLDERGEANVVVLVNPDNPTGRLIPAQRLAALAEALLARDGLLVVDEAFADVLTADTSLVPGLPAATVVLRSFGKAYGLAGLRLGFAVAQEDLADRLRAALGPWAVSGPALAIGAAALADDVWLHETRERLQEDSRRLDAVLATGGCEVLGGTPLFHLVRHPTASCVADSLARAGIHVRRFQAMPSWLRFGLPGSEDAWRRLELALRGVLEPHGEFDVRTRGIARDLD